MHFREYGTFRKNLITENPKRIARDLRFFKKFLDRLSFHLLLDWEHNKLNILNIRAMLDVIVDWIKTNGTNIILQIEKKVQLENAEWKIKPEKVEQFKGAYDFGGYYAGKSCEYCNKLMKTIYFRGYNKEKKRTFLPIGFICFNCQKIIILPEKLKEEIPNSESKPAESEKKIDYIDSDDIKEMLGGRLE